MADKTLADEATSADEVTPADRTPANATRANTTLVLALRLGVIAVAVLVTLLRLGPLAQTSAWLAAAAAVAIGFRQGRDAIDWIARGVGLGLVAVILTGPLLDAAGLRLWSSTWAVTVGTLAAIVVVVGHLRRTASTRTPEPLGAPVTEDDHGAEATSAADAGDPRRRRRSLLWGAAAVLLVVGSLIGTGISGRTGGPDVEMWLENPADVATGTGSVTVAVRTQVALPDARLSVTGLPPAAEVPYARPEATAPAPAPVPEQTFSIAAGETVRRAVAAPTGRVEIRLRSASQPGLDRALLLNR